MTVELLADTSLSIEARGAIAFLMATGRATFTIDDLRTAGLSRDGAYRVRGELFTRQLARKVSSSASELFNFSAFPDFRISGKPESAQHHIDHVLERESVVVPSSELPEIRKVRNEGQLTLVSCPEPLPPSAAPPPSPGRPVRERKPPAPPEIKALYPSVFDLCQSPQKGEKSIACRNLARDLYREFEATEAQIVAFGEWFRQHSTAARVAAVERRPVRAPKPSQVYAAWREFLAWEAEERARLERSRQRYTAPPPDDRPTPEEAAENRKRLAELVRERRANLWNTAPAA